MTPETVDLPTVVSPYVDPPTVEQPTWLPPEGTALTEAGFTVTVYPQGLPAVCALFDVGAHHVRVFLVQGQYLLVEQQRSEDDGRSILVNEWWPETAAAAVALAVELAGDLKQAYEASQAPAVIGDAVLAGRDGEVSAA